MRNLTLSLMSSFMLLGCMAGADDLASSTDPVTLAQCRSDADCDRGAACLSVEREGGVCVTDRCDSSRDCPEGTLCRGADGHCAVVEREPSTESRPDTRPEERPAECPRGSVPGAIRCAPGFESVVVSRAPLCQSCEPVLGTAARCRAAGLTPERCRHLVGGGGDEPTIAERCRAAGFTPAQCRRLWSATEPESPSIAERCRLAGMSFAECRRAVAGDHEIDLAERCRLAGFSLAECRRLTHDAGDRGWDIADRCRAAGISYDRCRALVAEDDPSTAERCRAAGYTPEQCRRLVEGASDSPRGADGSRR